MVRAIITYRTPDSRSSIRTFTIHLAAPDSQELEEEILATLDDLRAQGFAARVCYV